MTTATANPLAMVTPTIRTSMLLGRAITTTRTTAMATMTEGMDTCDEWQEADQAVGAP